MMQRKLFYNGFLIKTILPTCPFIDFFLQNSSKIKYLKLLEIAVDLILEIMRLTLTNWRYLCYCFKYISQEYCGKKLYFYIHRFLSYLSTGCPIEMFCFDFSLRTQFTLFMLFWLYDLWWKKISTIYPNPTCLLRFMLDER